MHKRNVISAAVSLLALSGCMENETIVGNNINLPPQANAGEDQELEYDDAPVSVRLDGRDSSDRDGRVVGYIWRNAAAGPDGGVLEGAPDPDDVARPELELDRGAHTFNLWVTDEQGAVSAPDQVTILVGVSAASACVEQVNPAVTSQCAECICEMSPECAQAAIDCSEDCWNLILCIALECGGDGSDIPCITSACVDSLGGADQATAVGPCITPCAASCVAPDGAGGAGDAGVDAGS